MGIVKYANKLSLFAIKDEKNAVVSDSYKALEISYFVREIQK